MKFLAIVVLYNPDEMLEKRVKVIANQVDNIIFYDNSSDEDMITSNRELANKIVNSIYVSYGRNDGIGVALSYGAKYAQSNGFDYYLTFDQDTLIPDNYVSELFSAIKTDRNIGVIGPIYNDANVNRESRFPIKKGFLTVRNTLSDKKDITDVITIISSGSLYPVYVFKKAGFFLDELFIDYIDNEFCLRLLKFGYRVCVDPHIIITHALGNRTKKGIIINCSPTNYPYYRKYYMTRNRLFVYKKYFKQFPSYIFYDIAAFIWDFLRVILFESDKLRKIKAYWQGIKDFISGNYGIMK